MASATVSASLFGIATNSTYFENASVLHKIYFLLFSEVVRAPNRSACILWFGLVQISNKVIRSDLSSGFLTFSTWFDDLSNVSVNGGPPVVLCHSVPCLGYTFMCTEKCAGPSFNTLLILVHGSTTQTLDGFPLYWILTQRRLSSMQNLFAQK